LILPLRGAVVHGFTAPGFVPFPQLVLAHRALLGMPHWVTETVRRTRVPQVRPWPPPDALLRRGRGSCPQVSPRLLDVRSQRGPLGGEVAGAIDDRLVKKWGRKFVGWGRYADPTDKPPGADKRRV